MIEPRSGDTGFPSTVVELVSPRWGSTFNTQLPSADALPPHHAQKQRALGPRRWANLWSRLRRWSHANNHALDNTRDDACQGRVILIHGTPAKTRGRPLPIRLQKLLRVLARSVGQLGAAQHAGNLLGALCRIERAN